MSRMYYALRDAKVNIAHYLREHGWTIYGYKADESDSMTDYYSPADWEGVAEKNGYVLVVDMNEWYLRNSGKDGMPTFQMNPSTSKWHIEKDGIILDKGTGISKFENLPDIWAFDYEIMEYKEGHRLYGGKKVLKASDVSDELQTNVDVFIALMNRFENIVSGQNNAGMKKVTVDVTKTVTKPVEITDRNVLQDNDIVTFPRYSGYWQYEANRSTSEYYIFVLLGKRWEKRSSRTPGTCYRFNKTRTDAAIQNGIMKLYKLQEVEETEQVEKWVRDGEHEQHAEQHKGFTCDIKEDVDTRDNSKIWIVKIPEKLSKEEYIKVNQYFKTLDSYYSRFKGGFLFKYDPTPVLKGA